MRVVIDARAYSWTGIGRYIRSLTTALASVATSHSFVLLLGEADAAQYKGPLEVVVVDDSYYSWREQVVFWRQLQRMEADLWHFTHFNVPMLFSKPYVVTIHDVTRFIFPGQKRQTLGQQIGYEYIFAQAVRRAQSVICVSRATRHDLLDLPLQLPDQVATIYEGIDVSSQGAVADIDRTKVRMLLGTREPYLLYVGVWMSHKNLERLVAAFGRLLPHYPTLKLVITGKPVPGYANILAVAQQYGVGDHIIFPGFVPDELLGALYAEASCFVFPSLYEGFGLPLLEAALYGTPIVTSNVSSMPEVMGRGALYVNPESVEDIEQGIHLVLEKAAVREQLRQAARERLSYFSWSRAAQQHLMLYEAAVE